MIGFIKWIIQQYKSYKICKFLEPSTEEREKLVMKNYVRYLGTWDYSRTTYCLDESVELQEDGEQNN